MESSFKPVNINRNNCMNLDTKSAIIAGTYASMDYEIGLELLKCGVPRLGILAEEDTNQTVEHLKRKFPLREIYYQKIDNYLLTETIYQAVNLLKIKWSYQMIDLFVINSIKLVRLETFRRRKIRGETLFSVANLTTVAICLMDDRILLGDPGIIVTTIPIEMYPFDSNLKIDDLKNHVIVGHMNSLRAEVIYANILAIFYKDKGATDHTFTKGKKLSSNENSPVKTNNKIEKSQIVSDQPESPHATPESSTSSTSSLAYDMDLNVKAVTPTDSNSNDLTDNATVIISEAQIIVDILRQKKPDCVLHIIHNNKISSIRI